MRLVEMGMLMGMLMRGRIGLKTDLIVGLTATLTQYMPTQIGAWFQASNNKDTTRSVTGRLACMFHNHAGD